MAPEQTQKPTADNQSGQDPAQLSKLREVFKSYGATDQDVLKLIDFLNPVISDYVYNITMAALGNQRIQAINQIVDQKGGDPELRMVSMSLAYEKITGKRIQDEILEFMDSLAEGLAQVKDTVKNALEETIKAGGSDQEQQERFEEIMNSIYTQQLQQITA